MVNRIQRVIDYHKMTSSAFADSIGVPRSTISHILSGRNNPSLDFVMKILARFPHVSTDWLVNGTGPLLKVTNSLFPDEDLDHIDNESARSTEPFEPMQARVNSPGLKNAAEVSPSPDYKQTEPLKAAESDNYFSNIVRSEDPPEYNAGRKWKNKASKVIILYEDDTFAEFIPR